MKLKIKKSMEISFFCSALYKRPVQGRFKPMHDSAELVAGRPISLSTKVPACVRRFETPNALNHGRKEPKRDISMSTTRFLLCITLKRWGHLLECNSLSENGWIMMATAKCFT
jgi:hypothetical protein